MLNSVYLNTSTTSTDFLLFLGDFVLYVWKWLFHRKYFCIVTVYICNLHLFFHSDINRTSRYTYIYVPHAYILFRFVIIHGCISHFSCMFNNIYILYHCFYIGDMYLLANFVVIPFFLLCSTKIFFLFLKNIFTIEKFIKKSCKNHIKYRRLAPFSLDKSGIARISYVV